MIYGPKEFTLKNGLKVTIKSPDVGDAQKLLDNIIGVAKTTNYILSTPQDFEKFINDITLEEGRIIKYNEGPDYQLCVYYKGEIIGNSNLDFHHHEKDMHRCSVGLQ